MRTKRSKTKFDHASDRVPVEIWREIASLLSRSQHKVLMRVPHVLGKLSSELFYRDIVLYYGSLPLSMIAHGDLSRHPGNHQLDRWHSKRCAGIISRILQDPQFAHRVRTMKVYASSRHDKMSRQMASLSHALTKLTKLEHFACHGSDYALSSVVAALREAVPQLRSLEIRYAEYDHPGFPTAIYNLESLSIAPVNVPVVLVCKGFFGNAPCLKNLRIGSHREIVPFITPLIMGNLTHLELNYSPSPPSPFPFEAVLRDGAHLESLRIEEPSSFQTPSVHFRRYSHSLPQLKRFAISFLSPTSAAEYDYDLFPTICDFLRNKPGLVTLELVAPNNSKSQKLLGFGRECWNFLTALDHLRCLSMTLTNLDDSEHYSQLIPRSVTSLTLLGLSLTLSDEARLEKVISVDSQAQWPKFLRFLCLDQYPSDRTARRIATYVPSVCVMQLQSSHYNVVIRVAGKPVQVERWTTRTEEYFRSEQLETHGCEDHLLCAFTTSRSNTYYYDY